MKTVNFYTHFAASKGLYQAVTLTHIYKARKRVIKRADHSERERDKKKQQWFSYRGSQNWNLCHDSLVYFSWTHTSHSLPLSLFCFIPLIFWFSPLYPRLPIHLQHTHFTMIAFGMIFLNWKYFFLLFRTNLRKSLMIGQNVKFVQNLLYNCFDTNWAQKKWSWTMSM